MKFDKKYTVTLTDRRPEAAQKSDGRPTLDTAVPGCLFSRDRPLPVHFFNPHAAPPYFVSSAIPLPPVLNPPQPSADSVANAVPLPSHGVDLAAEHPDRGATAADRGTCRGEELPRG
jgi:hypothetical protein